MGIGFGEFLIVSFMALIKYGIPIAFAIWIILTLRRIRSDHEIFRNKLDEIERVLMNKK